MASSLNKVFILGTLTRDPQVKFTPSGTAVCEIGLALNRRVKGRDNQWTEEATFVDVTLWGRQAEIAGEYLRKGRQAFIEGRLQLEQWDDKATGQKRSKLKVVAEELTLVGDSDRSPGGGSSGYSQSPRENGAPPVESPPNRGEHPPAPNYDAPVADDDIPF